MGKRYSIFVAPKHGFPEKEMIRGMAFNNEQEAEMFAKLEAINMYNKLAESPSTDYPTWDQMRFYLVERHPDKEIDDHDVQLLYDEYLEANIHWEIDGYRRID